MITANTDIYEGGFFWAKGEEVDAAHPYFERIKDRCDGEDEKTSEKEVSRNDKINALREKGIEVSGNIPKVELNALYASEISGKAVGE